MSKYLKWYDSYLDHTPTEDLAKNELESAHRKIKQLTESLAKANERARELERDSVSDKVSAIKDAFKYAEIKSKNWFKKQFDTMPIEYRDGIDCMVAFLDEYAEQLRKGQE